MNERIRALWAQMIETTINPILDFWGLEADIRVKDGVK
jgi:hypothetical protein